MEILRTRLEINYLLRIIEARLGQEIAVEEKSRNRYLKHVWSEILVCVGTSGSNQFSVSKNTTQNKHAGVSKMNMI